MAGRAANNTREYFSLASCPADENCVQAGDDEDSHVIECEAYISLLRRLHGPEPEGAEFFILRNVHEFGIYHEAAIFFSLPANTEEDKMTPSMEYALKCETGPEKWDAAALYELREKGHPFHQPAKVIPIKKAG